MSLLAASPGAKTGRRASRCRPLLGLRKAIEAVMLGRPAAVDPPSWANGLTSRVDRSQGSGQGVVHAAVGIAEHEVFVSVTGADEQLVRAHSPDGYRACRSVCACGGYGGEMGAPDLSRTPSKPGVHERLHDLAVRKALSAVFVLVFGAVVLVLPPVANPQLASAERTLQKPVVAVVVALIIVVTSAWRRRFAIGITALIAIVATVHIAYYIATTKAGRDAERRAADWQEVPLGDGAQGIAQNTPNVFGRAKLEWSGDALRLNLRSETGTTQQGFNLDAGPLGTRFLFQARARKIDGGEAVTCPLLFGINDVRSYFTFRLQDLPDGGQKAVAYEIVPNSPVFTSGFHGVLLGETQPLPYVNHWNVINPSERTTSTLGIEGDGNYYRFFVNRREVFARRIDTVRTNVVAVGVTVLANDLKSDAVCEFDKVTLKVAR